jgi:TolA-binding protein
MRKGVLLAVMLLAVLGGVQHARGDEIAELRKQIADMQRRLDQLEANQKQQSQAIEKKVSEQVSKAVDKEKIEALPESMKWVENIKISGDFRYRHESIDAEDLHDWATGHNRHRIRARLGIDAKVNDEFDLGFRIASGSGDPASTNQTLADSFSSKELWLDLAYFNYHPLAIDALTLRTDLGRRR